MVSDNEWNEFLMGNKHSPYPRVQESIRSQPNLTTPSYRASGKDGSAVSGRIDLDGVPAEPSGYIHWLDTTSRRIVENAPVFKHLRAVFVWLENCNKWVKLPFAFLGGWFLYHFFQVAIEGGPSGGRGEPSSDTGWYWFGAMIGALFGYQIPLVAGLFGRCLIGLSVWLSLLLLSLSAAVLSAWGLFKLVSWIF